MKGKYILLAILSLLSGWSIRDEPNEILFIGEPCDCLSEVAEADYCREEDMTQWLAAGEYRWVFLCFSDESEEDCRTVARYVIQTQPQAQIVLQGEEWLRQTAAEYRIGYAEDCCDIMESIRTERGYIWSRED